MSNHVNHLLVAEFDIDKGSSLTHQYPKKTGIEEHILAELMLPDGAHLREEDWTFFILNQHVVEEAIIKNTEQQEAFIKNGFIESKPVLSAYCYIYNSKINDWNKIQNENEEIFIQLLQDKIVLLDKETTNIINEIIPEHLMFFKECQIHCLNIYTKTKTYGIRLFNEDDYRLILLTLRNLIKQIPVIPQVDYEYQSISLPELKNESNVLYVLNLVRTKQIPGVRRGARVKAIAITSCHQWLHVFKPLLVIALDNYFETPEVRILENLYQSLNSLDISLMPRLSENERVILRASDDPTLFNEKFIEMEELALKMNTKNINQISNSQSKIVDRHIYETNIIYGNGVKAPIKVPIKIPMTMFPGEIGDFSVVQLISTFGNSANPTRHHAHLDNNSFTNPIIILINALLTEKRILFLGHLKPSGEVANFVLAACALGSCGILRGYSERCFPYTNLAGLDALLEVPGYIAGVTNPAFEEHPQWWDVLFNINTGKVTISPNLPASNNIENNIFNSTEKEREMLFSSASFDKNFMDEIMNSIQQKYGEHFIRDRFRSYITRFIEIASEYEKEAYGFTNIGLSYKNINDKYNLGVGAYFPNESYRKREILFYIHRIEGWRKSRSYELYKKDFHQEMLRKSINCIDLRRQTIILRKELSISNNKINTIFKALSNTIITDENVIEFLTHFLHNQGGLFPIAIALLHPWESVRINCARLLIRIDYTQIGSQILGHLNTFLGLTYQKAIHKYEMRWGKQWFITLNENLNNNMKMNNVGNSISTPNMQNISLQENNYSALNKQESNDTYNENRRLTSPSRNQTEVLTNSNTSSFNNNNNIQDQEMKKVLMNERNMNMNMNNQYYSNMEQNNINENNTVNESSKTPVMSRPDSRKSAFGVSSSSSSSNPTPKFPPPRNTSVQHSVRINKKVPNPINSNVKNNSEEVIHFGPFANDQSMNSDIQNQYRFNKDDFNSYNNNIITSQQTVETEKLVIPYINTSSAKNPVIKKLLEKQKMSQHSLIEKFNSLDQDSK